MLTEAGTVITTRNFAWRHVPAVSPIPPQLPLADDEERGEGEGKESASSQGGGGDDDLSESDLDVTEVRGQRHVTPLARKQAPAEPGSGTQGSEGSVPPSPPSAGGDVVGGMDFGSPNDSSSSGSNSNSEPDLDDASSELGGGGSEPGDDGAGNDSGGGDSEPGDDDTDSDDNGGNDGSASGDAEDAEEYVYDSADSRYPQGTEGKRLLWTVSSAGALRHGLERGRTRQQTREMENSEEALLSAALEGERGSEIVAEYIRESLVEEHLQEEQAYRADVADRMHEIEEEEYEREVKQAFRAIVEDQLREESTQRLLNPELSIPSPIGQKPSEVEALPTTYGDVKSQHRGLWEKAMQKEIGFQGTSGCAWILSNPWRRLSPLILRMSVSRIH